MDCCIFLADGYNENVLKKVLLSFFVFLFFVVFLELTAYAIDYIRMHKVFVFENKYNAQPFRHKVFAWDEIYPDENNLYSFFRKPYGSKYEKRPIVLMGCSFTYGEKLQYDETFGYILSEYIKSPVISIAHSGWGIQHSL